jgi:hypothetical protein
MSNRLKQTALFFEALLEINSMCQTVEELESWGIDKADQIKLLPPKERQSLREAYLNRKNQLKGKE